ncbi:hypothetical protein FJZ19_03250 [Candidatus Pacearchaeota archaeon]|nr:hypothetical protein [Candidatus Pacearchaeota archaeon]
MTAYVPYDGRTPRIQKLEREMIEAARKVDVVTFVLRCNLLGLKPSPYGDLYAQGVMELGRRRQNITRNPAYQNAVNSKPAEHEQPEPEDYRKTTKISYSKFLRLTDASFANPHDAFDETQYHEKMRILREAGYDKLIIAGGKSWPIEKVKVSRVLWAFSNTYLRAMRWAEKQMKAQEQKEKKEPRIIPAQPTPTRQHKQPARTRSKKIDRQPLLFPTYHGS